MKIKDLEKDDFKNAVEYAKIHFAELDLTEGEIKEMPVIEAFMFDETKEGLTYWGDLVGNFKNK